jgi:hypothetical protein
MNITEGIGNANPFYGELAEILGFFAKNACSFANLTHKRRDATFGSYISKRQVGSSSLCQDLGG